jgi:hypothetical protein
VKSTNSDGIWSDNFSSVKVIITPPWWQTIWAIGLYVLIFILGIRRTKNVQEKDYSKYKMPPRRYIGINPDSKSK